MPGMEGRRRIRLASCLLATIAIGLVSRRVSGPALVAEYPGDALYTVAVFWALLLAAPKISATPAALIAFTFSLLVELSQLLEFPWLVELRATRGGTLLLGQGFQVADLVAYAVGAIAAWALDGWIFKNATALET